MTVREECREDLGSPDICHTHSVANQFTVSRGMRRTASELAPILDQTGPSGVQRDSSA
jgi:hypothetical protein